MLTETSWDAHYDARFGKKKLNDTEQRDAVKVLMQTYLAAFSDLGIETWLMHGSLLGWWWNKEVCSLALFSLRRQADPPDRSYHGTQMQMSKYPSPAFTIWRRTIT